MLPDPMPQEMPVEVPQEATPIHEAPPSPSPSPYPDPAYLNMMARMEQEYMGRLAQEQQTRTMYEQALWQMQLNSLPEEQRPAAQAWYEYQQQQNYQNQTHQYQKQQLAAALQQQAAYTQQLEQSVLPLIKEKVYGKMSETHKVEKALLEMASTPQEAELITKVVKKLREGQVLEQRKATGVDGVPSPMPTSPNRGKADDIMKHYKGSGKTADFIRAMKQAGAW